MEGTVGHRTVRRFDFIFIPREIVSTTLDFLATPTYLYENDNYERVQKRVS